MDSGDKSLQLAVGKALLQGRRLFLTGGAGSGKTYFVKKLVRGFVEARKPVFVTASTGIAATLLFDEIARPDNLYLKGPFTVHSAAMLPFSEEEDRESLIFRGKQKLKDVSVIIIDEISMLDRTSFDRFMLRAPAHAGILLVGDFYQLPPVDEREDGEPEFAYYSTHFEDFELLELTGNHRQDDPRFIQFLKELRVGRLDVGYFADVSEALDFNHPVLFGTRRQAEVHNNGQIAQLAGPSIYSNVVVLHGEPRKAKQWFNNHARAPERIELREKMRVICIQNQTVQGSILVANGDIGTIIEIGPSEKANVPIGVEVFFDRLKTSFRIARWRYEKKTWQGGRSQLQFCLSQIPLIPAYGLTVHKAQGMTLDQVNVDGSRVNFASGQVYVAISRCRSKAGLRITNPNMFGAFTRQSVQDYYSRASRFIGRKSVQHVTTAPLKRPASTTSTLRGSPEPATKSLSREAVRTHQKPVSQGPVGIGSKANIEPHVSAVSTSPSVVQAQTITAPSQSNQVEGESTPYRKRKIGYWIIVGIVLFSILVAFLAGWLARGTGLAP